MGSSEFRPFPDRPLRVLLVGPTLDTIPGGIAVQADRLVKRLNQLPGIRIDQLSIVPTAPGPFRALQRIPGVRTLVTLATFVGQLFRRIPDYDVVHVNSARFSSFVISSLPAVIVAKLRRRPTILNYRNGNLAVELQRFRIFRRLLTWPDVLVVPSGFLEAVLAKVGLHARVITNQVDLNKFGYRVRDPLRPVFLSCRHFEDLYDVPTIIRAFRRIQDRFPEARLDVAGKGSQETLVRDLTASLQLQGVNFLGQIPAEGMAALYDGADVLLNSSVIDNTPGSLIEALAAGLPVVSTDAGGIPFIVTDQQTGRLVSCGDDAALAAAAIEALEHPAETLAMAERGRREAEQRYAWECVRDLWLALYGELAARRGGPRVAEPVG
ncbi:MAG: glycosyltransferase family 4 protein [Gemmatimonadales bacterium]